MLFLELTRVNLPCPFQIGLRWRNPALHQCDEWEDIILLRYSPSGAIVYIENDNLEGNPAGLKKWLFCGEEKSAIRAIDVIRIALNHQLTIATISNIFHPRCWIQSLCLLPIVIPLEFTIPSAEKLFHFIYFFIYRQDHYTYKHKL